MSVQNKTDGYVLLGFGRSWLHSEGTWNGMLIRKRCMPKDKRCHLTTSELEKPEACFGGAESLREFREVLALFTATGITMPGFKNMLEEGGKWNNGPKDHWGN